MSEVLEPAASLRTDSTSAAVPPSTGLSDFDTPNWSERNGSVAVLPMASAITWSMVGPPQSVANVLSMLERRSTYW
jgi:hypothetical protein